MNPRQVQETYRSVWRFAKFFLFHWLISQVVFVFAMVDDPYLTATEPYINERLFAWLSVGMLVLSFSSMIRIALQYEVPLQKVYLQNQPINFISKWKVLFCHSPFWIRAGIYCVLFCILPFDSFPALKLLGNHYFGNAYGKLLTGLCIGVILLGITFFSFSSVCWVWKQRVEPEFPHKTYNKKFRIICAAYLIGGIALSYLAPQIIPLFVNLPKLLGDPSAWKVFVWILLILITLIVVRYAGIVLRRRKFLRRLESVSREGHHRLSKVRKPFASLFFNYGGESFSVHCNSTDFSCKMLCGRKSKQPLVFTEEGTMEFVKTVQILGYELFQYKKTFDFGYSSEDKKILIINSVPQKMLLLWENKHISLEDGDRLGDYILYTEQSFLNALERECLYR